MPFRSPPHTSRRWSARPGAFTQDEFCSVKCRQGRSQTGVGWRALTKVVSTSASSLGAACSWGKRCQARWWGCSGLAEGRRGPPPTGVRPSSAPCAPPLPVHQGWRPPCGAKARCRAKDYEQLVGSCTCCGRRRRSRGDLGGRIVVRADAADSQDAGARKSGRVPGAPVSPGVPAQRPVATCAVKTKKEEEMT